MIKKKYKGENDLRPKESDKKICETLALHGPLSMYSIAKRADLSNSIVYTMIKDPERGLERKDIVKSIDRKKWRTGLKTANYILTFRGLVEFLGTTKLPNSTIDKILRIYASLHDYAIFSEWENLKKEWFGSTIYTILRNAALSAMRQPYSPIISRSQESKAGPVDPKEHGEAGWRNNFTWFFLKEIESQDRNLKLATGILRGEGFEPLFTIEGNRMHVEPLAHRPIKNTVIYKLMKEILEERRFQCHFHLAEIKKLEKLFIS